MLALPFHLCGQTAEVKIIRPEDTAILRALWAKKQQADYEFNQAYFAIERQYVGYVTTAKSGNVTVSVVNPLPGWEYGVNFNQDFTAATPRTTESKKEAAPYEPACQPLPDHVSTVPTQPWLYLH